MYSSYEGNFKPQFKEGITKVKWIDPKLKKLKIYTQILINF